MRERHASGEGAPAREAHENRSYSLSESAENSYWLRGSRADKCSRWARKLSIKEIRDRLQTCNTVYGQDSEGLILHH